MRRGETKTEVAFDDKRHLSDRPKDPTNKWGNRVTEKQFLVALNKTGGVKADAARVLGLSSRTVCARVNASPGLQRAIFEAIDRFAAVNIKRAIRNGDR